MYGAVVAGVNFEFRCRSPPPTTTHPPKEYQS